MNELLTTAEMRLADLQAEALGVPSLDLMERAGEAVAREAAAMAAAGSRIVVICGVGNNGGDGFVAARRLATLGFDCTVALLGAVANLSRDAAAMRARWTGALTVATPASVSGADLVIDALFGAGLNRSPDGAAADVIAAINHCGAPVLAVDTPSGLDGTTGKAPGAVVAARRTVTFFRKKPGHLLLPGRALCGDVVVADIGIPRETLDPIRPTAFENQPNLWIGSYPWPRLDGHKYTRGHAVVVSGPAEQTGAARLGARAALRVGAGLVTLIGDRAATAVNAMHSTGVMVRSVAGAAALADFLADVRRNAVLIGPGASSGSETAAAVLAALQTSAAVVLDADALTSFEGDAQANERPRRLGFLDDAAGERIGPETLMPAIAGRSAPVVLTPHGGEFDRLFGASQADKLTAAREAAKRSGAIVVLKGADTVIAAPDGRAAVNANAPAWLATAGSGDVLAGLVTGLLAQRMPAFDAACAAVWLHGAAASRFGIGLIAEDLPETLPGVLAALHAMPSARD